ncbi:MAG TPA: hypothetical protein VHC21_00855 [Candidatus Saccharimonadales bacterium]|nr:hypothetical protein [Candidatus Saccharimonadales bacterium]
MVWYWGKPVAKAGKKPGRAVGYVGSALSLLCKTASFYQIFTRFFQPFTHTIFGILTAVNGLFLPTFHTTNKDNNYLNKPYYC